MNGLEGMEYALTSKYYKNYFSHEGAATSQGL